MFRYFFVMFLFFLPAQALASDWNKLVSIVTSGQGQISSIFEGPEGMVGIIVGPAEGVEDKGKVLLWGLPNGLLMAGNLFDRNGRDLNDVVYKNQPEWFAANNEKGDAYELLEKKLLTAIDQGRTFSQGSGENKIFAFIDVLCPHCEESFSYVQNNLENLKDHEVIWIPVSINPQNAAMSASLLEGDINVFKTKESSYQHNESVEKILQNNELIVLTGHSGVPAYVVFSENDVRVAHGGNIARFVD